MRNQQQIRSNAGWNARMGGPNGAARNGPALLAGLLRCAGADALSRCSIRPASGMGRCRATGAAETAVTRWFAAASPSLADGSTRRSPSEVLEALRPLGIQAALDALDQTQNRTDEKRRSLELALQKARYEASRIERQYQATEPENRLVAAELEKRWNNALTHVAELERRLEEATASAPQLTPNSANNCSHSATILEQLWDHPRLTDVLEETHPAEPCLQEVIADTTDDPPTVHLKLHWAGGSHTELTVRKNKTGYHNHVNSEEVTELIRELALVCEDRAIVSILNRLGYRTGNANTWTEKRVQHVRHTKGFPACPPPEQRLWITMQQAAVALGVSDAVVRRLIEQKTLAGKTDRQVRPLDDRTRSAHSSSRPQGRPSHTHGAPISIARTQ